MSTYETTTMDLLISAFNLLSSSAPEHHKCFEQCDGCDWDVLQVMIAKHMKEVEARASDQEAAL